MRTKRSLNCRYYQIQGLIALLEQQPTQNTQVTVVKESPGFLAVRPTPKGEYRDL